MTDSNSAPELLHIDYLLRCPVRPGSDSDTLCEWEADASLAEMQQLLSRQLRPLSAVLMATAKSYGMSVSCVPTGGPRRTQDSLVLVLRLAVVLPQSDQQQLPLDRAMFDELRTRLFEQVAQVERASAECDVHVRAGQVPVLVLPEETTGASHEVVCGTEQIRQAVAALRQYGSSQCDGGGLVCRYDDGTELELAPAAQLPSTRPGGECRRFGFFNCLDVHRYRVMLLPGPREKGGELKLQFREQMLPRVQQAIDARALVQARFETTLEIRHGLQVAGSDRTLIDFAACEKDMFT